MSVLAKLQLYSRRRIITGGSKLAAKKENAKLVILSP